MSMTRGFHLLPQLHLRPIWSVRSAPLLPCTTDPLSTLVSERVSLNRPKQGGLLLQHGRHQKKNTRALRAQQGQRYLGDPSAYLGRHAEHTRWDTFGWARDPIWRSGAGGRGGSRISSISSLNVRMVYHVLPSFLRSFHSFRPFPAP